MALRKWSKVCGPIQEENTLLKIIRFIFKMAEKLVYFFHTNLLISMVDKNTVIQVTTAIAIDKGILA